MTFSCELRQAFFHPTKAFQSKNLAPFADCFKGFVSFLTLELSCGIVVRANGKSEKRQHTTGLPQTSAQHLTSRQLENKSQSCNSIQTIRQKTCVLLDTANSDISQRYTSHQWYFKSLQLVWSFTVYNTITAYGMKNELTFPSKKPNCFPVQQHSFE